MAQRFQVVIVGGGPVGVALAVELAQRDIRCVVVERHLEVGRIPKGQNLTQRTLEHFYFWGCVDELRAARLLPPGYPIGGLTAYRNLMSEYWYAPPGLEQVRSYYFQDNERLPQYLTEEVLRKRLDDLPAASTLFGWAATAIEQDEQGVRVQIAGDSWPYENDVLEAHYVVGCDGARSLVREQVGIVREGPNFDQKMLLAVFRSPELHAALGRFPDRTTYRILKPELGGVWQFFGRVDVGERFFFHGPVPRDTVASDHEFLQSVLEDAAGLSFPVEFEHVGFWELRVEVATTYRAGRAFIAGDASHSHPPYGGFGLNTGLEDVANLGWKLAAVEDGWGGEELLDSYSEERQPVFLETGQAMIVGGINRDNAFMQRYSPDVDRAEFEAEWNKRTSGDVAGPAYEPNYEGSTVVLGASGASIGVAGNHSTAARAGHHLTPVLLSSGRNIYEELGTNFTLLALDANDGDVEALVSAASELSIPLKVVRDTYDEGRKELESRLVLVRPDQYVVFAGDDLPTSARELLARVVGRGITS
jgi:2-polyprenyl-6-methoxyphenol hydroxylase-like FAD-dependent oxidoreductase